MTKKLFCLFVFVFTAIHAQASWLDPKDIRSDFTLLQAGSSNISQAEFNSLIQDVENVYSPIVRQFGGSLNISGSWTEERPNAAARQMFSAWQVQISGGLARRPELTHDGFVLILCHELGHHLGGFVIAPAPVPFIPAWGSNEGQADYFATHVCAKRMWGDDTQLNESFRVSADKEIKDLCNKVWSTNEEQNLCYRVAVATQSVVNTMAVLMNKPLPKFSTPDPTIVTQTNHNHPNPQCRMDTSLQGALCVAPFNERIIPGKNASGGVTSIQAEREAAQNSCMASSGYNIGLRPACWFKARL